MPLRGSTTYSRNLYDVRPRLDRLAEEQINRSDRRSLENLARLERSGNRTADQLGQMGDIFKDFANIPNQYRQGKTGNIKLGQLSREDQWRQEMEGGGDGAALSEEQARNVPQSSPGSSIIDGAGSSGDFQNPTLDYIQGKTSTQKYLGLPERVETTVIPGTQLSPEVRTSPTAATVLDGKYKAGINPEIRTPDEIEKRAIYGQSDLLNRPEERQVSPSMAMKPAPIAEEQQAYAPSAAQRAKDTNERRMWMAFLMKAEADAKNAAQGRLADPYRQEQLDIARERLQLDREKMGQEKGIDPYKMGQLELEKERLQLDRDKMGKVGKGGITPYQEYQIGRQRDLDAQKRADKDAAAQLKKEGKNLSPGDIRKTQEGKDALSEVSRLGKSMETWKDIMGPIEGRLRGANPYDTDAQKFQADITRAAQKIGKYMEGGVLRAEDTIKYEKMLPALSDTPEVASYKLSQVNTMLEQKQLEEADTLQQQGYNTKGVLSGGGNTKEETSNYGIKTMPDGKKYQKVPGGWVPIGRQ